MNNPTPNESYTKSAQYYDLIYLTKSEEMYQNTIKDFHLLAEEILDRPVDSMLDLGCGTGNHAIRLAEWGIKVTGVDLSSDQLQYAKEKVKDKQLDVEFIEADISKIPEKYRIENTYDAGAAFFSGFCYLLEDKEVLSFLEHMDTMIKPEGFLYFEFWNSIAINPGNKGTFETKKDDLHLLRTHTTEYDVMTGIVTMPMKHIIWEEDTIIDHFVEEHHLRTYTIPHLRSLIDQSNWKIREVFSGYYNQGKEERKPNHDDFRLYAILTH